MSRQTPFGMAEIASVDVTFETVADLDDSDDAADWITSGHVLDASEVAYLRSLVLPGSIRPISKG